MKSLSILYLIFIAIDWVALTLANNLEYSKDIVCVDGVYVISESELGSAVTLLYDLFIYSQTILIWRIFYRIPQNYGYLLPSEEHDITINISPEISHHSKASMVNENLVEEFL